jgi:hypothetical protein
MEERKPDRPAIQPAIAVTGSRKPHPESGCCLGLFALDEGPNCGATVHPPEAFQKAQQRLSDLVFRGGQAGLADGS